MTTIVDFEWTRGHDYEFARDKTGHLIRQVGKGRDHVKPLDLPSKAGLAVAFADLDGTPDRCRAFARAYGLLTTPAHDGAAEPLELWQREIKKMRALLSMTGMVRTANSRRVHMKMTTLEVGAALRLAGYATGPRSPATEPAGRDDCALRAV